VEIFCRDRNILNELQTDSTGYVLDEVIWCSSNEARRTWWLLWRRSLKLLIYAGEIVDQATYVW